MPEQGREGVSERWLCVLLPSSHDNGGRKGEMGRVGPGERKCAF